MERMKAIVLTGPTGSGKTPLGETLEAQGLWGERCCHFDFGKHLRAVADGTLAPTGWTDAKTQFVRRVLEEGALLESDAYEIPALLIADFSARRQLASRDLLILNGWPRHPGQAEAVKDYTDVRLVAHLDCEETVIRARIRRNTGGDRTGREDDTDSLITRKWEIYKKRTEPLLDHYRRNKVQIVPLPVDDTTRPKTLARTLNQTPNPWAY